MKIKTSELIDEALDRVVAQCEGVAYHLPDLLLKFEPSKFWAQGGPIIDEARITLRVNACLPGRWVAFIDFGGSNCNVKARQSGPTALIAAMRCYVASKLGDEVEIPEELL